MKTSINILNLKTAILILIGFAGAGGMIAAAKPAQALDDLAAGPGQIISEQVGQGINYATPGQGAQFGYFSYFKGIPEVFDGLPRNESTALLTFYQDLTNVWVGTNGPMRIICREGTTTIYLATTNGADFSNPNSFRAGVPVQTSMVRQQVVIDTSTQGFTAVNEDVVTSTSSFLLDGRRYEAGKVGDILRTTRTGRLNAPGLSPIGWFAGHTVAAGSDQPRLQAERSSSGGSVKISVNGTPGKRYDIERSPDLTNWTAWMSVTNSGRVAALLDSPEASLAKVFYRARTD